MDRGKLLSEIECIEESASKGSFWESESYQQRLLDTILHLCGIVKELLAEVEK